LRNQKTKEKPKPKSTTMESRLARKQMQTHGLGENQHPPQSTQSFTEYGKKPSGYNKTKTHSGKTNLYHNGHEGHYGHNGKLTFEKSKTPTINTNTPFTTEYPTGENIAHPGHRTQIGDHDWVVPISKEWAKVPKVSQSKANVTWVTTKPKHTTHSGKTNLKHNGHEGRKHRPARSPTTRAKTLPFPHFDLKSKCTSGSCSSQRDEPSR
jgi:hypothetical protein